MIDYNEIIENLNDENVKQLLDSLDIPYKESENCLIMPTVCHHDNIEEASWKLYYYKNTHLFMCYTDCQSMSIFKFLKNFYEARNIEYDWYTDILQVVINCTTAKSYSHSDRYKSIRNQYENKKKRQELPTYPNGIIDCFVQYYPAEWLCDHITAAAMNKYNIRFAPSQNKIIIPHYNIDSQLVGIRARALNPEDVELFGKYMPIQIEGKWYSHPLSLNLYGLNWNHKAIRQHHMVYIFESEKSCMQVESWNMPNLSVACCGSNINKFQIDILMRTCQPSEIIVCFDSEEHKEEDKYFTKLWNICKKYLSYSNMSFIYDRQHLLDYKDSPSDKGEQIFRRLLEERVKVS